MTMVQLSEEELRQLTETWKDMQETIRQLRTSHKNSAQVHISAGGLGVWLSALLAGLAFVLMLVMTLLYIDHNRKIDDLGDYLQVIYTQAPHLKPENLDERKASDKPD